MLIFIASRIAIPNNQKIVRTTKETRLARKYTDLIWSLLRPAVKPAKIGTKEIGSIATNISKVLSTNVSNILNIYDLNGFRMLFWEYARDHNKL